MRCAYPPPQHLAYLPCLSLDRQGNIPANWPDPPITLPPRTASYSRSTAARRAPSSGKGHSLGHMKGSGNLRRLGSRLSPGHRLPSQGPPSCPGWARNRCPNPGQGTADMVLLEQEARDGVCLVLLHCGSHHSTPSVNQPPFWACVSLSPRPELRTYKETMHLLPEPSLHLVCTRFLQFPGECSGLASQAGKRRPDPTPCQWSESRCPPSFCLLGYLPV